MFLGPSLDLHIFDSRQLVAVPNPNYAESVAALLGVGAASLVVVPLRAGVQVEGSFRLALLSLGVRDVDTEVSDEPAAKLLTALSVTSAHLRLGMRARLSGPVSARVSCG